MIFRSLLVMSLLMMVASCGGSSSHDETPLSELKSTIDATLDELISSNQTSVTRLEDEGAPLSGTDTDKVLSEIDAYPDVIDALTVDSKAVVQAVKPDEYRNLLGTSLGEQEHMQMMSTRHEPLFSEIFMALEGVMSIALEYPLHNASEFRGSVSLLIDHLALFKRISDPILNGTGFKMTLQQLDGVVLWDEDMSQVGKNILTDPSFQAYPDLIRQVRETIATEEGTGQYTYRVAGSDKVASINCEWTTIRKADVEWRLVIFSKAA